MASKRTGGAARPKRASRTSPDPAPHRPDWPVLAPALLGVALTAYLTAVAWWDAGLAYCSAGSGCDIVQGSRWSTLLGAPLSLWGLLTYAAIAGVAWRVRSPGRRWRYLWGLAALGFAVSLYLTAISVFVLEALCAYCLASLAIIAAIFAVVAARRPAPGPAPRWRELAPTTVAATGVVVLALHLHYSGVFDPAAGPEDPQLRALAIHLHDHGARFYGAYWCSHCQRQKALFTASMDRLPYVECSLAGRNGPMAPACLLAGVEDYPTWIIDGRRYQGVMEPATLARVTGFGWEATPAPR